MHHKKITTRLLSSTAILAAVSTAGTAVAQDADATFGVNDIIVTAQKREQSIQDVPIAVTALGKSSLEVNRIQAADNLTGLAPGLVARQTAGSLGAISFAMRGVNANPSAPLQDKQISLYIDGVYVGGSRGTLGELMEVERIEVLRGPQGTLFGRNSTAGAVNVVTRNPTGDLAFRQDVTIGNQKHIRTRTTIDTPSFGPFSAYATYIHDEDRGDVRNLGAGTVWDRTNPFTDVGVQTSPNYVGGRNYENVFAALRYDAGGDVTATYKLDWSKGKFTSPARTTPVINTVGNRVNFPGVGPTTIGGPNLLGNMLAGIIAAQPAGGGRFGPVALNTSDRRPDAYNQAFATNGFQRVQGHSFTVEWQASDNIAVKNILAYRKNGVYSGGATIAGLSGLEFTAGAVQPYATFVAFAQGLLNGTEDPATQAAVIGGIGQSLTPQIGSYFAPFEGQSYGRHWQFSEELQVNYTANRLNVTAGLMYFQSSTTDSALPGYTPNITFTPVPTTIPLGNPAIGMGSLKAVGKTKSYAGYAQVEFDVTDQLAIVLGGRYTRDEKVGTFNGDGTFVGDRNAEGEIVYASIISDRFNKNKFTYSVGLNFKPTDDILIYAKHSTGFLSGGIYADLAFAPEEATSYEIGVKSDWFDRRLQANITAWKSDYKNAQAASSGIAVGRPDLPIAIVTNGKLKAEGIELDVNVAPVRGLTFGGNLGYTKAEIKNPSPILADGYELLSTGQPKFVGTVNAQYVTPPLFGDATLLARVDMTFQSKTRVLQAAGIPIDFPAFAPFEFIPSKQLVNARLALRDIDVGGANVELAVWSKNLFDNKKPLYPFQYPYFLMTTLYEPARTFGLDVIVKFNP